MKGYVYTISEGRYRMEVISHRGDLHAGADYITAQAAYDACVAAGGTEIYMTIQDE